MIILYLAIGALFFALCIALVKVFEGLRSAP